MAEEQRIAALLLEAIEQLSSAPAAAAGKLEEVRIAVAPFDDLIDVHGRTCSLLAQAHLAAGDLEAANMAAMSAMRIARQLDDAAGLGEIRDLHQSIAAERDREKRQKAAQRAATDLASRSLNDLIQQAASDLALADILIKHAGALRLHNDQEGAVSSARQAILAADRSKAVRERVLARITMTELQQHDAQRHLVEALEIADQASETTLIGLIARAAELAGVTLPSHYLPSEISGRLS